MSLLKIAVTLGLSVGLWLLVGVILGYEIMIKYYSRTDLVEGIRFTWMGISGILCYYLGYLFYTKGFFGQTTLDKIILKQKDKLLSK